MRNRFARSEWRGACLASPTAPVGIRPLAALREGLRFLRERLASRLWVAPSGPRENRNALTQIEDLLRDLLDLIDSERGAVALMKRGLTLGKLSAGAGGPTIGSSNRLGIE